MTARGGTLAGIVAFEWRYATRRLTFAVAAGSLALMGFALSATAFGPADVRLNGPWAVTASVGLLTLVSVLAATLLSAPALLRDTEHGMAEVVYATSVTKRDYLLGRFAGSFLAVAAALAAGLAGLVAGAHLVSHDVSRVAPFDAIPYLRAFALLALPGALFVSAFLFAVAALTRSTPATYVAGVFLYVLYFAAALFTDSPLVAGSRPASPEDLALPALVDPFGLSAFFEQTRHWTAAERDARNVELAGRFLTNRLLCVGAALLALAVAHRRFAFRLPAPRKAAPGDSGEATGPPPAFRPVASRGGSPWAPLVSATRVELRFLLRSWPLAALAVLWIANAAIEIGQSYRSVELGTDLLPTSGLLAGSIARALSPFGILFLAYFAAEVVWRERAARMSEVVDATPAPSALFLVSKAAALATVLVAFAASAAGVGVLFQVSSGTEVEPLVYVSLLWFAVFPLLLLAVLALLVQTLSPHRHVGLLLTVAAIAVLHRGALVGAEHPLLRYAAAPEVTWSAMSGFGPEALSFAWFQAYGAALAALLGLVAWGAWRRGTDPRLAPRLAALPRRWGRGGRIAAAASAAVLATVGGLAYWRTDVRNAYETERGLSAWKAAYERTYGAESGLAEPAVEHLQAAFDLFPEERRYRVRGRYRLANRTAEAIRSVRVVVRRDVEVADLRLAGAPPAEVVRRFGTHRFDLARPMAPGATLDLAFDLAVVRRGPRADGEDHDVVGNGSWVPGPNVLPSIGYRRSYELVDRAERARAGLAERPGESSPETDVPASAGRMTFDVTVSTPADQLPVAPGVLASSRVESGRRASRFVATRPVSATFAVASARYAIARARHGGVDVEVYHHPGHGRNAGRVLEAATRSLDLCAERYGAYPFPQLRVAEVPSRGLGAAGFALPGVVYLAEDRVFLADLDDPARTDVVTKRVAHEVAHQWWGHQLSPAPGPGATALVESLARHTELRVLKARHGPAALEPVLRAEADRYLSGRTGGDEVPLVDVGGQAYLYYAKGSLAMAALSELAGEEAVDRALRGLLAEATASGRAPNADDLLARLLQAAPEADRPLVEEWWTRIVLYDLRATSAAVEKGAGGRYRVDVTVEAERSDATDGVERKAAMDGFVEVAVLGDVPDEGRDAPVLASGRFRLAGAARLSFLVDAPPRAVSVDPRRLLLDRHRADNVREIVGGP